MLAVRLFFFFGQPKGREVSAPDWSGIARCKKSCGAPSESLVCSLAVSQRDLMKDGELILVIMPLPTSHPWHHKVIYLRTVSFIPNAFSRLKSRLRS